VDGQLIATRVAGLAGEPVEVDEKALSCLSARLRGPVLRSGADGFDEAVRIWNGMIAKVPALVVQPVSTADVREAINFARTHGLLLSVKGGGHHVAGTSLADGGLTLDYLGHDSAVKALGLEL
jgi:hypothetical protein